MSNIRGRKSLKRHDSIYMEVTRPSVTNTAGSNRANLVHVAEVHDSRSKLLESSGEDSWAHQKTTSVKSPRKQSVNLRKKFRKPRKGSETDTLSEVDSGEASEDLDKEAGWKQHRQDTEDASDKSSQSKTLVVPSMRHIKRASPIEMYETVDTSSTRDSSQDLSSIIRKTRHREPRRGSLTDTLSEATDSESTVARRPVAPPRPSLDTTVDSQEAFSQESIDQLSIDQPQPPVRLRKFKRKKKAGEERDRESDLHDRNDDDLKSDADNKSEQQASADDMLVVRIEGCDTLRFLDFCRCPTIRLHVVDPVSGEYKQSLTNPNATVAPLETQPFNMKIHRSVKPVWDEDMVIREPSNLIASKQTLLLFELFDYVKKNTVAWAFLKLVASNGASNIGRPLRLQLFKPVKNGKQSETIPKCYSWWSKGKYSQYKSTLYITANSISSSALDQAAGTAEQKEGDEKLSLDKAGDDTDLEEVMWGRYPGQSCKLPNDLLAEKECGKDGSLCLAFSHSGRLLAAPTSVGIMLYVIPSARLYLSLDKQQGLVYGLAWSEDDEYLVSVSADSTACLWHVKKKNTQPIKVLAHPSYVYCCCWISSDRFATGCSDGVVRVWSLNDPGESTPVEFLAKHSSRVNSIASTERSVETQRSELTDNESVISTDYLLVSGDSQGIIIMWRYDTASQKFEVEKVLKVKELRGLIIYKIILVGKKSEGKRLLVQTKDCLIRLLDLASGAILQVYEGGYIVKSKVSSCSLCGCGRRVWSASEDSCLVAWDFATGERVATYSVTKVSPHASFTIAMHPLDHIIAYTSHSPSDYPTISFIHYSKEGNGTNIGQIILEKCRRGVTRWSALDAPLYEVPPVKVKAPPSLRSVASPATPVSRLSPAPTPAPRITRRFSGERGRLALDTVASALTSHPTNINKSSTKAEKKKIEESKKTFSSKIPKPTREAESKSADQDLHTRDSRLSHIIGKMDLILIQASPKQLTSVK